MKWIQTYSGQIINLDSVAYIDVQGLDVVAHFDDNGQRLPFLIASGSDMDECKDIVHRIGRFIEGVKTGYRNAFYSFPEADKARAKVEQTWPKGQGAGGGQPSEAKLPKLSLRYIDGDTEGPYHVYADDDLVEKLFLDKADRLFPNEADSTDEET